MQLTYRICLLLLFILVKTYARADDKYIVTTRHLTTDDGLVTDALTCGLQDAQGFVWLGTYDGLQRYDGTAFRLFSREKSGLQSNHIANIALAADGLLWITYASVEEQVGRKVDLLDPATGKVLPLRTAFARNLPVPEEQVYLVLGNEAGDLFMITFGSDVWMYRAGHFKKIYNHPVPLWLIRGGWHHQVKGTHLWLMTVDGDAVYTDTSGQWRAVHHPGLTVCLPLAAYPDGHALMLGDKHPAGDQYLHRPWTRMVMAAPDGSTAPVLISHYKGFRSPSFDDYYISSKWAMLSSRLVFQSHSNGISMMMEDGHTVLSILDSANASSLNNALLGAFFSDKGGRNWICTSRGLFIADVRKNSFTHYFDKTQLATSVAMGNQARGIYRRPSGETVVAMWEGVYEIKDSSKQVISLLPCLNPTVLYPDSTHLWSVSRHLWTDLNDRSIKMTLPGKLGAGNEIWALCRYASRLYAGTLHGIYDITGAPSTWYKLPGSDSLARESWCCQLFISKDSTLWAATSTGLLSIKNGRILARYASGLADRRLNIPCSDIYCVYEDTAGDFWLCTNGEGLVQWRRRQKSFKSYTVADGLGSNTIYSLLPDDQGYYWLSTAHGLIRFDPTTAKTKNYTSKDGLTDNEFNRLSYFKAPDGRLYFGGTNGINAFFPAELNSMQESGYNSPLRVISLIRYRASSNQVDNVTAQLQQTGSIIFRPGDNAYTLTFQQLDYETRPHAYAYKIDGLEERWNYIQEGSIRLGNLPYGQYTLHVHGQNPWGNSKELTIAINVPRPFYRQAWFIIVLSIVIALLLLFGIRARLRARLRALRAANELLEATIAQRTSQLGDMLHEKDLLMKEIHHRVKNNLQVITGLLEIQADRSGNPAVKEALEDGQNRVLSIAFIHQNLYQHDDLAGVEMQSFVRELASHILDVGTLPGKSILAEQDIAIITLDIDTAVPLGLIINELFTNSCKHAFKDKAHGSIFIRLSEEKDAPGSYCLQYEDDGPGLAAGIDFNNADTLGLRLIRELAEQLDGTLQYTGSRFVLSFKNFETRNKD